VSGTMGKVIVGFTVDDGEDYDAICEEVGDVVQKALNVWYASRGKEVLHCEPMVG
jgi:hypothetical protein